MSRQGAKRKSRWGLFLPISIFAILVAAYTAYWVIARGELEAGVDAWIDAERAGGSVVEFSSKELSGFPFLFELTLDDPVYQTRDATRWEGEKLTLSMQPWNWNHVIARSPGLNRLTDDMGVRHTLELDEKSAGSLSWDKTGVRRMGLMLADAPALIDGTNVHFQGFSLNLAPRGESPDDLMVAVQWDQIQLPETPEFAPWLGTEIGPSRLVGEVRGFFPAFRVSGTNAVQLKNSLIHREGAVEIAQLLVDWGPVDLGLKMDAAFQNGAAQGSVGVRLDNIETLREAIKSEGLFDTQTEAALLVMETSSANGGFFVLPIKDNGIYIMGQRLLELPLSGS